MDLYFVVTGRDSVELEVVRELRPPKILISYHYFHNRNLKDFVKAIGYVPEILLDSGAYSAFTIGRNISLLDYMRYIDENKDFIARYIALDVIGDPELTYVYYTIMKKEGYSPIPVFHYQDDISWLKKYVDDGERFIALGGTVFQTNKDEVASWMNYLWMCFPDLRFHLLGSSSKKILRYYQIVSADSSTWIKQAINGKPEHIKGKNREAKKQRAIWNMKQLLRMQENISSAC